MSERQQTQMFDTTLEVETESFPNVVGDLGFFIGYTSDGYLDTNIGIITPAEIYE